MECSVTKKQVTKKKVVQQEIGNQEEGNRCLPAKAASPLSPTGSLPGVVPGLMSDKKRYVNQLLLNLKELRGIMGHVTHYIVPYRVVTQTQHHQ